MLFDLFHLIAIGIGFIFGLLIGSICAHSRNRPARPIRTPKISPKITDDKPYRIRERQVHHTKRVEKINFKPDSFMQDFAARHEAMREAMRVQMKDLSDLPKVQADFPLDLKNTIVVQSDQIISCMPENPCHCCRRTKVFFSPVCDLQFGHRGICARKDCSKKHSENPLQLIRDAISKSRNSIDICMYRFSKQLIIKRDLINARKRGVLVRVLTDISGGRPTANGESDYLNHSIFLTDMKDNDIEVRGYKVDGLMHNKFAIFDHKFLIHGSMNWTWGGIHRNCEATFQLSNYMLVSKFFEEFVHLWRNGKDWPLEGR